MNTHKKSLKIGMVTRHFLPEIGGINYHVYYLSRELVKMGHEVTVYAIKWSPERLDEEWIDGVHVKRYKRYSLSKSSTTRELLPGLYKSLLKDDLDLIHLHNIGIYNCTTPIISAIKKIPYFATIHTFGSITQPNFLKKFLGNTIRFGLIKRAKSIFCVSSNEAKIVAKIKGKNVFHVPNGVDLEMVDSVNPNFKKKYNLEDKVILLNVGRICRQKGQLTLVKALSMILKKFPNTMCIFASPIFEKDYYNHMLREIEKHNLKNHVIFLNGVGTKDVIDLYKSCDVFVLPSIYEGLPLAICEAWAAKIPVIATSIENIKAMVKDNYNAILFPVFDHNLLAEKIEIVLSDKELVRKMIENGRKEVEEKYSWSRIAEVIEEHYFRALEGE